MTFGPSPVMCPLSCAPKTTNPEHMKDSIDIFDFELTDDDMARIDALDSGKRFFNVPLEEQERTLGAFVPAD